MALLGGFGVKYFADQPSLLLLRFVARDLKETPVFILGNFREAEVRASPALSRLIGELAHEGQEIPLCGLSESEVGQLIEQRTGAGGDAALVTQLMQTTAGNPLFVDGVLRALIATGKEISGNSLSARDFKVPHGIGEAIRSRLSFLSDQANAILAIAAVAGPEFDFECLRTITGQPPEAVIQALDEARRDSLVDSVWDKTLRYRFAHDLIREAIYQDLPAPNRLRTHRQIAETLEERYASDPAPHLAELAYHYRQAAPLGDTAKAIDYSIRAGEAALTIFAYEETANHWTRALELLEHQIGGKMQRAGLYLRLCWLAATIDKFTRIGYLERALKLYEELNQPHEMARVHATLGLFLSGPGATNIPRAIEHYRSA